MKGATPLPGPLGVDISRAIMNLTEALRPSSHFSWWRRTLGLYFEHFLAFANSTQSEYRNISRKLRANSYISYVRDLTGLRSEKSLKISLKTLVCTRTAISRAPNLNLTKNQIGTRPFWAFSVYVVLSGTFLKFFWFEPALRARWARRHRKKKFRKIFHLKKMISKAFGKFRKKIPKENFYHCHQFCDART